MSLGNLSDLFPKVISCNYIFDIQYIHFVHLSIYIYIKNIYTYIYIHELNDNSSILRHTETHACPRKKAKQLIVCFLTKVCSIHIPESYTHIYIIYTVMYAKGFVFCRV